MIPDSYVNTAQGIQASQCSRSLNTIGTLAVSTTLWPADSSWLPRPYHKTLPASPCLCPLWYNWATPRPRLYALSCQPLQRYHSGTTGSSTWRPPSPPASSFSPVNSAPTSLHSSPPAAKHQRRSSSLQPTGPHSSSTHWQAAPPPPAAPCWKCSVHACGEWCPPASKTLLQPPTSPCARYVHCIAAYALHGAYVLQQHLYLIACCCQHLLPTLLGLPRWMHAHDGVSRIRTVS